MQENWFIYWKWKIVDIDQDKKCTKDDEQKHWVTYRITQAKVEKEWCTVGYRETQ